MTAGATPFPAPITRSEVMASHAARAGAGSGSRSGCSCRERRRHPPGSGAAEEPTASATTGTASTPSLIGLGRLTALLAGYLALIEVLLLARLPFLERLVGFDRLTIWHRRNGHAVIGLVLAHVVFSVWGYARQDRHSFFREYWNWLTLPQPGAAKIGGSGGILGSAHRRRPPPRTPA